MRGTKFLKQENRQNKTPSDSPNNERKLRCSSCGSAMQFSYSVDFRTGAGGKVKLLFGESINPGMSLLPLNVYVCPDCGKIDLFAAKAIKEALLHVADKHKEVSPSSL